MSKVLKRMRFIGVSGERSNRLSLMIMKRGIPEAFRGAVTDEVSYNCQKDKWTLNELISFCVQEEERLKQDKTESAHLASTSKDKGKRKNKDNKVVASNGPEQKKQRVEVTCFFCNKPGHTKKECTKYAAWRVKKGLPELPKTK
ncbi:hypothetical protein CK203_060777 [Vitis vinifera]|uniref:CCHC-type domain-containing protein n=1 Tax=Vitis vinifera TaxID=29760 RepID=A0A438FUP1_VITVI|nr:hypothetical protein CK203_060777 [Vitis vinifera]